MSIVYKTYHFVCTRLFLDFFIDDLGYNVEGGQINIENWVMIYQIFKI